LSGLRVLQRKRLDYPPGNNRIVDVPISVFLGAVRLRAYPSGLGLRVDRAMRGFAISFFTAASIRSFESLFRFGVCFLLSVIGTIVFVSSKNTGQFRTAHGFSGIAGSAICDSPPNLLSKVRRFGT
jgi:hypothetical protein